MANVKKTKNQEVKNSEKQVVKPKQKEIKKIKVEENVIPLAVHKRTQTAEGWKRSILKKKVGRKAKPQK